MIILTFDPFSSLPDLSFEPSFGIPLSPLPSEWFFPFHPLLGRLGFKIHPYLLWFQDLIIAPLPWRLLAMILYGKILLTTLQTDLSPNLFSRALNHFYFETLNFGRRYRFVLCPAIWNFWILHLLPCKSPSLSPFTFLFFPFFLILAIHDDLLWHSRCGLIFNWVLVVPLASHLLGIVENLEMIILCTSILAACQRKPIQFQFAFSLVSANYMGYVPWFYNVCVNDLVTLLYSLL